MSKPDKPTEASFLDKLKGGLTDRLNVFKDDPLDAVMFWKSMSGASKKQADAFKDSKNKMSEFALDMYEGTDADKKQEAFEKAIETMDPSAFLVRETTDPKEFKFLTILGGKKAELVEAIAKASIRERLEKAAASGAKVDDKAVNDEYTADKTKHDGAGTPEDKGKTDFGKATADVEKMISTVKDNLTNLEKMIDPKTKKLKIGSKKDMAIMASLLGVSAVVLVLAITLMIVSKTVSAKAMTDFLQTAVSKVSFGKVSPSIDACAGFAKVITEKGLFVGAALAGLGTAGVVESRLRLNNAGLEYVGQSNAVFEGIASNIGGKKIVAKAKEAEAAKGGKGGK